ncbi:hypothetical protein MMR14E_28780 [Methylobacterium mesophilicum]
MEDRILELGPESVMAFVAVPVVGATAGAVPPVADCFKRVRAICGRYGVLLILDDVMCDMGRTGTRAVPAAAKSRKSVIRTHRARRCPLSRAV